MKLVKSILMVSAVALMASCSVSYPGFATRNPIGTKVGVAERKIYLGIAFGHTDLGVQTAAKNGKITKVATVDITIKGGLISKTYKVTVTGE